MKASPEFYEFGNQSSSVDPEARQPVTLGWRDVTQPLPPTNIQPRISREEANWQADLDYARLTSHRIIAEMREAADDAAHRPWQSGRAHGSGEPHFRGEKF